MIDAYKMRISVIAAMGSQVKLYKIIDAYYLKNKYQAHRLAMNDKCYDSSLFKWKSIEYEVYCKRILGLFCIDENYYLDLFMKEINEKLYNYLSHGDELCDLLKILQLSLDSKADGQKNYDLVILAYGYARRHGREWLNAEHDQFFEQIIEDQFTKFGGEVTLTLLNTDKKRCRHHWLKFCDAHDLRTKPRTFYEFYLNVAEWMEGRGVDKYQAGLYFIPTIMQSDGIDAMFLFPCELNENDILICVRTYLERIPDGLIPNYDLMIEHMVTSLFVVALVKEFKKVKVYYFKNNQETVFREMENYEEIINNQHDQLFQANIEIKKLREENDRFKQKRSESEKIAHGEIAKCQKALKEEIKILERTIKKEREENLANDQELKRLRLVLLTQKPEYKIGHELAKIEVNQHKKLMYAVSRDYAALKIKGLKEELPHLMIYEGNMPEKATAIFIDYQQISHSDYYEVIGWAKRKKIPYHYIQSKGVSETIIEMAEKLEVVC